MYSSVAYIPHINPAVHKSAVPSHMLLCSCILYFSSRWEFNTGTSVMVTSLLLTLHHSVTALILNPTTVGTLVLTSRPGRFPLGKYTGAYWVWYWLGARIGLYVLG